jgi:hypothetical protein
MKKEDTATPAHPARRRLLQAGVVAIVAGIGSRASAQQKIAPNLVQYQDKPKNGQQCDGCLQFEAPASCKIVEGKISPSGWCAAFSPKSK